MPYRLLYLLPKNWISHFVGVLVEARLPFGLHKTLKLWFIRQYNVDCSEAEFPVERYETLGRFFTRKLKAGARPLSQAQLVSPVDGALTQAGRFSKESAHPALTQIKGMEYSLRDLVGPAWDLGEYANGAYLTIYLAPYDYHRIHAPLDGFVTQAGYIPGALWPVNTWSVRNIGGLFTVNERITVELRGSHGSALIVMVGATNVGKITLDFHSGLYGNGRPRASERIWRPSKPLPLKKGDGLGCFELGSTVLLILSESLAESLDPDRLRTGTRPEGVPLKMGEGLSDARDLGG